MKGQAKVSGQIEYHPDDTTPTSSSSNLESGYRKFYEDHPLSPHPSPQAGISQELVGKNDDTYRLFIVPTS